MNPNIFKADKAHYITTDPDFKVSVFFSKSNVSQTVQDRAIVTMNINRMSYAISRMVPFPVTSSDP